MGRITSFDQEYARVRSPCTMLLRLQIKFLGTRQHSMQNGKPENRRTYATKKFNPHKG